MNNPKAKDNLKPMKKGETLNPNGRPKLMKNILNGVPKDSQEKVYSILAYALTLPSLKEAREYILANKVKAGEYGIVLEIVLKRLMDDKEGFEGLMAVLDRIYGKPKQQVDAKVDGDIDYHFKFGE